MNDLWGHRLSWRQTLAPDAEVAPLQKQDLVRLERLLEQILVELRNLNEWKLREAAVRG